MPCQLWYCTLIRLKKAGSKEKTREKRHMSFGRQITPINRESVKFQYFLEDIIKMNTYLGLFTPCDAQGPFLGPRRGFSLDASKWLSHPGVMNAVTTSLCFPGMDCCWGFEGVSVITEFFTGWGDKPHAQSPAWRATGAVLCQVPPP